MKSDRETCCKNSSKDLKNCQKTKSYPDDAPSKLDNFSMVFRHQEEKEITLYAENNRMPRDQEGTRKKKDGSKAMYDLAQSRT